MQQINGGAGLIMESPSAYFKYVAFVALCATLSKTILTKTYIDRLPQGSRVPAQLLKKNDLVASAPSRSYHMHCLVIASAAHPHEFFGKAGF
jgi:hypothetical protein